MENIIKLIKHGKIIAVLRGNSTEKVIRTVDALIDGGVNLIEVTFTNEAPLRIIEKCAGCDDIVIGAGTVLNLKDAKDAVAAGAKYIVSPCLVPEIVTWGNDNNILVMPGVFTPTEVYQAMRLETKVYKLFPGSTGCIGHMKSLRGPFPGINIVPTGGVDRNNIREWFAAGAMAVGLGTNLAPKESIAREDYASIRTLAVEIMSLLDSAKVSQI